MLVEDDDSVRSIPIIILQFDGYDVVDVTCGEEAIHALETQSFDLLFTDVNLPGDMTGIDVACRARKLNPKIKVLFTTGYMSNDILQNDEFDAKVDLINKPYRKAELLAKVHALLEGDS